MAPEKKMKIYVVMGSSGEWSDRSEWVICYYLDEELAKKHVLLGEAREREILLETERRMPVVRALQEKARTLFPDKPNINYDRQAYRKRLDWLVEEYKKIKTPENTRKDMPNPYVGTDNTYGSVSLYYTAVEPGPIVEIEET